MGRWYSGDHRFTRQEKEQLTQKAKVIMEHDRGPRTPPAISIRECQQAIEIAGGIRILLRGEERLITEVRTGGGGNTRWFSGDLRFTVTEQHRLTRLARAIIEKSRNSKRQLSLPRLVSCHIGIVACIGVDFFQTKRGESHAANPIQGDVGGAGEANAERDHNPWSA